MRVFVVDDDAGTHGATSERGGSELFFEWSEKALAMASLDNVVRVAFDCEGVNLSRVGTLEIVSLCFDENVDEAAPNTIFLVDVGPACDTNILQKRLDLVKSILEHENIEKIIHDSRMDCDALFHHHSIAPVTIHDTSCFHAVQTGQTDKNLNDVLYCNGLARNGYRDKSIYKQNPRFWAIRPLDTTMKGWASEDVDKLHKLAAKQREKLTEEKQERAKLVSMEFAAGVRNMELARDLKLTGTVKVGSFIGTRGSNVRSLQHRTNTIIYQDFGLMHPFGSPIWMVYYSEIDSLNQVKRAMGYK